MKLIVDEWRRYRKLAGSRHLTVRRHVVEAQTTGARNC
jgi:hypothetical protein